MLQVFFIGILLYLSSVQASPCVPGYFCDERARDAITSEASCELRDEILDGLWGQTNKLKIICLLIDLNIVSETEIPDELMALMSQEIDPFSKEEAEAQSVEMALSALVRRCTLNETCREQYGCIPAIICRPRPPDN